MTTTTIQKTRKRSKKYQVNAELIKKNLGKKELLSLEEAVDLLFSLEQPKFADGAMIEFHAHLSINPAKSDQLIRVSVALPHGTGKKVRVAAFVTSDKEAEANAAGADLVGGEELIEEIKQSGNINFDKAVAQPEMMKKLPAIARLLGTAGVMPNPKTGTVGDNIGELVSQIKAGKVDFKNDKTGNVHVSCGKINPEFTKEKVIENILAILDALEKSKPEAVKKSLITRAYLSTTQSPSIRIR